MLNLTTDARMVPLIQQNSQRITDELGIPFVSAVFYSVYLDIMLMYVAGMVDPQVAEPFLFGREHRSA